MLRADIIWHSYEGVAHTIETLHLGPLINRANSAFKQSLRGLGISISTRQPRISRHWQCHLKVMYISCVDSRTFLARPKAGFFLSIIAHRIVKGSNYLVVFARSPVYVCALSSRFTQIKWLLNIRIFDSRTGCIRVRSSSWWGVIGRGNNNVARVVLYQRGRAEATVELFGLHYSRSEEKEIS